MRRNFVFSICAFAVFGEIFGENRYDNDALLGSKPARFSRYASIDRSADAKDMPHNRIEKPSRPQPTLAGTVPPAGIDVPHPHHHHTPGGELWGYADDNGPPHWPQACRDGVHQSPVDFRAVDLDYVWMDELHFVGYDLSGSVNVRNNGHGVQIDGFDRWRPQDRPYIYGGGLNGKYKLSQFHFHWSYGHDDGSEHTVGTLHYPVEIHLVHTKDGYSPSEVTTKPDGIAVIGVFMTLGEVGGPWATLDAALRKVTFKGDSTRIFNYSVGVNLPNNPQNFYRYDGSLTTPGCNEAVIWTVLAEPIGITDAQLKVLRSVKIGTREVLPDSNSRPTQPLNGRRIQYRSASLSRERLCGAAATPSPSTSAVGTVSSFLNGFSSSAALTTAATLWLLTVGIIVTF